MADYEISALQYNLVYDFLSFVFASMAATTLFCWLSLPSIVDRYKSALIISGLVTFIAAYHYFRIFNSWVEAFQFEENGELTATGIPFNDAYRYMDWLLTVPLLLIEIIMVMNLDAEETQSKSISLGCAAAAMIILGYPGELDLDESALGKRWFYWVLAMIPFGYIVYTLLIGLAAATDSESDPKIRKLIRWAQWATVISWCTYPIVYLFPMFGLTGELAIVTIQLGYSVSDIVAKCGVGLLVYNITKAKSAAAKSGTSEISNLYGATN